MMAANPTIPRAEPLTPDAATPLLAVDAISDGVDEEVVLDGVDERDALVLELELELELDPSGKAAWNRPAW